MDEIPQKKPLNASNAMVWGEFADQNADHLW